MATMPAASVLGEDGGRSAGEVAPGVTLVKNVRIPVRDGVRLAADLYFPTCCARGRRRRSRSSWSTSRTARTRSLPGTRFYEYLPQHGYAVARVDIRGTGASAGIDAPTSTCCRSSSTASTRSSGSPASRGATAT